jgi:hypothetical protein
MRTYIPNLHVVQRKCIFYDLSQKNGIDIVGVMVNVLVSNTVDRGFEPRTMQLVFVASPLSTQH